MKIALVHDYLVEAGGAERVLAALHELFPDAPIYTSVYDPRTALPALRGARIVTSFLQKLPHSRRVYKWWLPLYPMAFEQFDLAGYDVVISSSSAFAKGVITGPETLHISYCYTPSRFAWRYHEYLRREPAGLGRRLALPFLLYSLRTWDVSAAQRVDDFLTTCQNTAQRIRKVYGRSAEIIYAPVDTDFYTAGPGAGGAAEPAPDFALRAAPAGPFFLLASRLAPYKRADLAVIACTRLGLPLVVVGDGIGRKALQRLAGPTVRFAGHVSDVTLREYYRRCAALIFPGEEDFGLVPLEANACGRPVIAFQAGGALETVVEGVTGTFFDAQTPDSLAGVLRRFDPLAYDPAALRRHALQFDKRVFQRRILHYIRARVPAVADLAVVAA
jgi:glycosyltransferase involved in cell wall biosynthesis